MIFNFFKNPKSRQEKYGTLYELLSSIIQYALENEATQCLIGKPENIDIEFNPICLPVFYKINDQWQKTFDLPLSLHLELLQMIEDFCIEKSDQDDDFSLNEEYIFERIAKREFLYTDDSGLSHCFKVFLTKNYNYCFEKVK